VADALAKQDVNRICELVAWLFESVMNFMGTLTCCRGWSLIPSRSCEIVRGLVLTSRISMMETLWLWLTLLLQGLEL